MVRRLDPSETHQPEVLEWTFPASVGGYRLVGCSRARHATSFVVPELGLILDAGAKVHGGLHEDVFITHTHTDHVHMLTHVKTRRKPPRLYAPAHAMPLIEGFFLAAQELTDNQPTPEGFVRDPTHTSIPLRPGEVADLPRRGTRLRVRTVATQHSVPSLGYAFYEVKEKLKPELAGLPGAEIAARRASGQAVSEEVERGLFAYLGDTTEEVFALHPELLALPVILTECTFLTPEEDARAAQTGHSCWSRLAPLIAAHPETTFVLGHLSLRYTREEARALTAARQPENVVWWLG